MEHDVDLVLGGGGIKGVAQAGALRAVEAAGYRIRRVAGTSAGAVVGALAAAGMPAADMGQLVRDLDPAVFRDASRLSRLGTPGKGLSLLQRLGVYDGDGLHRWLSVLLDGLGVRTFADLRITDDPRSHLHGERAYRLVVVALDASRGRLVRLPWDYRLYGLDPDAQPVADALRASCSIPLFYRPATLTAGDGGPVHRLVDAGFLSAVPVDVFDRDDGLPPRWPTFGLRLSAPPEGARSTVPSRRGSGLWRGLTSLLRAHERWELDKPEAAARTVWIDPGPVRAVDFGLDRRARQRLFDQGERTMARFLSAWDFDAYRRRFRRADATPAAFTAGFGVTRISVAGGVS